MCLEGCQIFQRHGLENRAEHGVVYDAVTVKAEEPEQITQRSCQHGRREAGSNFGNRHLNHFVYKTI